MTEEDLVSSSHRYTHLVQADIKNFYPSIYTHSIAWAIHGKRHIRKGNNRHDYTLLGNRLDRLFQYSNDQRTNGIPIGPVVSDIVAEIVAAAVDRALTKSVVSIGLNCEMTRFKDDYRILVRGESAGESVIKLLQAALKGFDLELSEQKTSIHELPDGLFRPWVSLYHAAYPRRRQTLSWKEFRELYLTVLRIDELHPGTGVIDRFLADIVSAGISVLPAPDGPLYTRRAAERTKLLSSHIRPAPEAVTSARADVRPTGAPAFRAFLRHRSTRVPFLRQAGFVALSPRVSLPAPVAPRSSAASRRTAAGSDALPPAGASSTAHASPAAPRSSPAAAGDS